MPKKGNSSERKKSNNPRDPANRKSVQSPIPSFGVNDIVDAFQPVSDWVDNGVDLWTGQQSYSDFTSRYNKLTDGWYSTLANGLPLVSNLHNALLGRDSAKDYLNNNGLGWGDMEGYNDIKLLGRSSQAIGSLAHQSGSYLSNIGNDLGKLYSGQTSSVNLRNGYASRMMESW